jgi:HTH-type transcriptional regulator, global nitrogen regulator NrpRI
MIGQETREVERKIAAILKVLSDSPEPLGGRIISRRLKEHGIDLGERAVRYHLKMMDERGFTSTKRYRDGRSITQPGLEELKSTLVCDKVGFVTDRLELLAYLTNFDLSEHTGYIPIDLSLFPKREFPRALEVMKSVFEAGLCASNLVAVATEGERLGETMVPQGKIGFATVCSAMVSGSMLKAGIPVDSRFGGILQIKHNEPTRFVELIEYNGSTIDPFEIFIAGRMTSAMKSAKNGDGKILASFQEIPLPSKTEANTVIEKLKAADLCNLVIMGKASEPVCEIPVRLNKVGLVLPSGLNAIAATAETGIDVTSKAMNGVVGFGELRSFWSL